MIEEVSGDLKWPPKELRGAQENFKEFQKLSGGSGGLQETLIELLRRLQWVPRWLQGTNREFSVDSEGLRCFFLEGFRGFHVASEGF